jgi:hypothetical protein
MAVPIEWGRDPSLNAVGRFTAQSVEASGVRAELVHRLRNLDLTVDLVAPGSRQRGGLVRRRCVHTDLLALAAR